MLYLHKSKLTGFSFEILSDVYCDPLRGENLSLPTCFPGSALYVMSLAYLVGFLCIALATTPGLIIVGRFCGGVGLGLTLSVTPVYLVEVTTISTRGMLGVVPPLFTQVSSHS